MRELRVTGLRGPRGVSTLSPGRRASGLRCTVSSVLGSTQGSVLGWNGSSAALATSSLQGSGPAGAPDTGQQPRCSPPAGAGLSVSFQGLMRWPGCRWGRSNKQLAQELSPPSRQAFPTHASRSPFPTEPGVSCVCFVFHTNIFLAVPLALADSCSPHSSWKGVPTGRTGFWDPRGTCPTHPSLPGRLPQGRAAVVRRCLFPETPLPCASLLRCPCRRAAREEAVPVALGRKEVMGTVTDALTSS